MVLSAPPDRRLQLPLTLEGRVLKDADGRDLLAVSALSSTLIYLGPEDPLAFLEALVEAVNRGEE